ncbi:hypothetical protein [Sinorhizobium meliloti]|uniref:hypothetical protein n=1 Tax=Rhizobium meliloti TaxID=382 RepID=UPI000FDC03F7|nr:hypothetical protein [Sinorhizobium meliloti]RVG83688.1 hypothetical protein CN218_33865 [Sinorhizobium meliloti]
MVTVISTPGWSAAGSARKVLTPVEDSLEVVHLWNSDTMRGDVRNLGINFAKDKRDSIVIGSPSLHSDGKSAVFKSLSNYIQSR